MRNWVTERSKCSPIEMFEVLRRAAMEDRLVRNNILDASEDKDRFAYKDYPPDTFAIYDTWARTQRRAVDFKRTDDAITVTSVLGAASSTFSVEVSLNDEMECVFKIDGEERTAWQVLMRALEPLFFGRTT